MQITLGLLGQMYTLSIQRGWISDVNFWKCLSQFCKLRRASPSLAAVCRQSFGCCLPLHYCMLQWSVMSLYIGNCSSCVWREGRTSICWFPGKGRGEWVFLDLLYVLWGQSLIYWLGSRAKERHVQAEENSSSEQDNLVCSGSPTASGCLTVTFFAISELC